MASVSRAEAGDDGKLDSAHEKLFPYFAHGTRGRVRGWMCRKRLRVEMSVR